MAESAGFGDQIALSNMAMARSFDGSANAILALLKVKGS